MACIIPLAFCPNGCRLVARFTPVTYVLDGARATIIDGAGNATLGQYLIPLLIMGAICIPSRHLGFHACREVRQGDRQTQARRLN
ncbi:MAG UNVERIFIED_CONTAM: ABC transporter permease [Anaerolineae bacterium]